MTTAESLCLTSLNRINNRNRGMRQVVDFGNRCKKKSYNPPRQEYGTPSRTNLPETSMPKRDKKGSDRTSGFDQVVLDSETGEFGVVAQVEFFEQAGTVGVNRLDTNVVGGGNLTVGLTQGELAQNLEFTG